MTIDSDVVESPDWLEPLLAGLRAAGPLPFLVPPADVVDGLRQAAVLVLFGDGATGPDVLLLQRSADMRSHAGQPAFPGGRIDPSDGGAVAAALREAQEETGLDPNGVEVIATLSELWIPPSGNVVTPVIGWWRVPSDVHPAEPAEVETVARVPIADLVDPANRLIVRHPSGLESPAFRVADMLVWGFTAAVLDWLLTIAGWARDWDRSVVESMPVPSAVPEVRA
jgi:8-oxo-dGTP pyrophosphatase MutT (NUDIX family)